MNKLNLSSLKRKLKQFKNEEKITTIDLSSYIEKEKKDFWDRISENVYYDKKKMF